MLYACLEVANCSLSEIFLTEESLLFHSPDDTQYLRIINLVPDTVYMFHLAAGNAVGFSDKIKFRVRTSKDDIEQSGIYSFRYLCFDHDSKNI